MEAVLEGWLLKSPPEKKLVRARWTKRWFVLKESGRLPGQYVLEYYNNPKQVKKRQKPRRVIDLDQCEQVDSNVPCEQHDEFNFMFSIHTLERRFFLMTETEDDMLRWVQSLCRACGLQRDSSGGSEDDASEQEGTDNHLPHAMGQSPSMLSQASLSVQTASLRNNSGGGASSGGGAFASPHLGKSDAARNNMGPVPAANSRTAVPSAVSTFPRMPTASLFASLPPSSGEDETSAGSDATTITNLHGTVILPSSATPITTTTRSRPPPLMLRTTNINSILLSNNLLDNVFNSSSMNKTHRHHTRQSDSASLPVAPQPPKPVMPVLLPHDHDNDIIDINWSKEHQTYRRSGSDSPYFHLHDFRTGIACINTPASVRSSNSSSFDDSDAAMPSSFADAGQAYDVPPSFTRPAVNDAENFVSISNFSSLPTVPETSTVFLPDPNNMPSTIAVPVAAAGTKPAVPTKPNFICNQIAKQPPAAASSASSNTIALAQKTEPEDFYAAPVEHIYDEKLPCGGSNKLDGLNKQLKKQSISSTGLPQSLSSSIHTLRSPSVTGSNVFSSSSLNMASPRQPQSILHGPITQSKNLNMSPPVSIDRSLFSARQFGTTNSSARRYTKSTSTTSSSLPQQPTTPPAPVTATTEVSPSSIYDLPGVDHYRTRTTREKAVDVVLAAAADNSDRSKDSAESTATTITAFDKPLAPLAPAAVEEVSETLKNTLLNGLAGNVPFSADASSASHYDSPATLTSSSLLLLPTRVKKDRSGEATNDGSGDAGDAPGSSSDDEEDAITTTSDNDEDDGGQHVADSPAASSSKLRGALPPLRPLQHGSGSSPLQQQHRPWAAAGTFSAHAAAIDMARSEAKIAQDLQIEPSGMPMSSSSSSSVSSLIAATENKQSSNTITTNRQHSTSRSSIGRSKRVESRQNHRQQQQLQQHAEDGQQPMSRFVIPSSNNSAPILSHSNSSDLEYLHVSNASITSLPTAGLPHSNSATEYLSIDPVGIAVASGHAPPISDQNLNVPPPNVPPRSPMNLANAAAPPQPNLYSSSAQHRRSSSSSVTSPPLPSPSAAAFNRRQQQLPPGSSFTVGRHLHASTRSNTSSISGVSNKSSSNTNAGNDAVVTGRDQYHEIDVFRTNALMQTMMTARATGGGGAGNSGTLNTRESAMSRGSSSTLK